MLSILLMMYKLIEPFDCDWWCDSTDLSNDYLCTNNERSHKCIRISYLTVLIVQKNEGRKKKRLCEIWLAKVLNASQIQDEFNYQQNGMHKMRASMRTHCIEWLVSEVNRMKMNINTEFQLEWHQHAKGKQMNVRHRQTIPFSIVPMCVRFCATTYSAQNKTISYSLCCNWTVDIVRLICFCRLGHILSEVYLGWHEFGSHDQHS